MEATAKALKVKGQRYRADPVTPIAIKAIDGGPPGQQFIRVQMHQHQVDIVDRDGRVVSSDPDKRFTTTISLIWGEGSWRVYDSSV
jgi:hypothetical protein